MGPCSNLNPNPKGSEEAGVGLINSEMPPAVLLEGGTCRREPGGGVWDLTRGIEGFCLTGLSLRNCIMRAILVSELEGVPFDIPADIPFDIAFGQG